MLLSGKLKPAAVIVPLLVVPGVVVVPPQAAATIASVASAATNQTEPLMRFIRSSLALAGRPRSNPRVVNIIHLGGLEGAGALDDGCLEQSDATWHERPLQARQQQLSRQGESGDEQCAGEGPRVVTPREPVDYVAAQPSARDQRGESRGGHYLHGRRSNSGHDQRYRQWQLNAKDLGELAVAHAAGGVLDVRIDFAHRHIAVRDHRGN